MPPETFSLLVLAAIVIVPVAYVLGTYNRLVKLRFTIRESWSNVDTELKRRYDLIPNLVNTVKGYAQHERGLLEEVTRLREVCVKNVGTPNEQAQTENELIRLLNALMVRVESYPQLKASTNFLELQHELVNTEDRIQAARRFYNGNVRENNNLVQSFPMNLVAQMFGFRDREFFEIQDVAVRAAPKVEM